MSADPIQPLKSWVDRLLEIAIALTAAALLLNWAWLLIRPLIPVFVIMAGLSATATFIVRRNRSW
jgi:hypothetical protein